MARIIDPLLDFLKDVGVTIRIFAAPEHQERLNYLLSKVGASLPENFEPVAVGDHGGVTRPYAPGFVSTLKKPPEGITTCKFREEGGGMVSIASTAFALGLIQHGFLPTTWKGRYENPTNQDLSSND